MSDAGMTGILQTVGGIGDIYQGLTDRRIAKKWLKRGDPFGAYRKQYGDMLMGFMKDPDSFLKSDMFQSMLNQGMEGVSRQMAAHGYLNSGNEQTALADYISTKSWDMFQSEQDILGKLAGAWIDPNEAMAGYAKGRSGAVGSVAGGIGGILKGAGSIFKSFGFSDRRLKTNIVRVGTTPGGTPWYKYTFIWGEEGEGVMADEAPSAAVSRDAFGLLHVDYSKLT